MELLIQERSSETASVLLSVSVPDSTLPIPSMESYYTPSMALSVRLVLKIAYINDLNWWFGNFELMDITIRNYPSFPKSFIGNPLFKHIDSCLEHAGMTS